MSESKTEKSVYETLSSVDCGKHISKKNGLSYLPWAWAWGILKSYYPDSSYKIYEDENGWNYHTDGRSAWVKCSVTVHGMENIEYLPIMDYRNKSIPLDRLSSMDVTKAIQRALTKAIARHGLGLYIYAGEDLPDAMDGNRLDEEEPKEAKKTERKEHAAPKAYVKENPTTFREKAILDMNELKISSDEAVKKYGVNKKTTEEEWKQIYKKLEALKKLDSLDDSGDEENGVSD